MIMCSTYGRTALKRHRPSPHRAVRGYPRHLNTSGVNSYIKNGTSLRAIDNCSVLWTMIKVLIQRTYPDPLRTKTSGQSIA
jgi:hypothetical protein